MTCQDSEQCMQAFVDDQLTGETLEAFLYHIGNCRVCYEELETTYLLKEALSRLEDGTSFDLHEELQNKVALMRRCVSFSNRLAVIRRLVLTVAGLALATEMYYLYLYL